MKLLVTVRADEGIKGYTETTIPLIKKKAEEWGSDFKLLITDSNCSGDGRFHFRILELYDLLDEYDRILNLDADIIITDNCPNPFEVIDEDKIGTNLEDKGSRQGPRRQTMRQVQNQWGDIGWKCDYINTGFFMVSKIHKPIFKDLGKFWTGFGFDDVQIGYQIKKNGFEFQELDYTWNHMIMYAEPWNGNPDRFKSKIIHYAGRGIFEHGVNSKIEQIKRDYKKIYVEN